MSIAYSEPHPNYGAAHWRNGLILVWTGQVTVDALSEIADFGQKLAQQHPRYYLVSVNPGGLPFPDAETRSFAGKLVKDRENAVLCAITVVEGDGLFASAGRVMLKTIFALQRSGMDNVVCRDLAEAARAIAPLIDPPASEEEIISTLEAVRGAAMKSKRAVA